MFDFKGLINALLNKGGNDPVGNLKSATIWVQELPQSDIHQALREILKALAKLNKNPNTSLRERVKVLMYLDEKARPLQATLCREYLSGIETSDANAQQILPTILQFWDEMGAGYQLCIRMITAHASNTKLREQLPLLTARGIYHFAMQAKWCHLRYQTVESHIWRRLNRLYQFAESEKFDRAPVTLYRDLAETTCASEYIQAMMLSLANPAGLHPAQIELLDLWLDNLGKSIVIESDFRPQRQLYAVNLGDMKPPRKLRRNMLGEKYRYWGIGLLQVTIEKIKDQLQQGELPIHLKLGEDCRLPGCLELIEEIMLRWSGKKTTRIHERVAAEKTLLVSRGLTNIIAQLRGNKNATLSAQYNFENTISIQHNAPKPSGEPELFDAGAQQWQVADESLSGYGVTFNSSSNRSIKIGTLLGLQSTIGNSFSLGTVRRIQNEATRQVHVGIQTLSNNALAVELHLLAGEAGKPARAIYLPENAKLELGRSLLLPKTFHATGRQVKLKAQGKAYTIRLQAPVNEGPDYIQAGFDVLAKG